MPYRKITAIIRESQLAGVRDALEDVAITGLCITQVLDYGEYTTAGLSDGVVEHVRMEVFTPTEYLQAVVSAIMETAHSGLVGDGVIAISVMESIYRISSKTMA